MLKTGFFAAAAMMLGLAGPLAAQDMATAAAPMTDAVAAPVPAPLVTVPPPGAAPEAADAATSEPAEDASYDPMAPTPGIGQPTPGAIDFQPQATKLGQEAKFINNVILLPIMTAVALFVLGLLFWVIVRYRAAANPVPSKTAHNTTIEIIWTIVPVFILVGIAVPSISLLAKQYRPADADAVVVKVTGYQWNWGYAYPDHGIDEYISNMLPREEAEQRGEPFQLAVDNRMVVPVGQQVKVIVTGGDVIHSFAVPSLWTKMDAVPGRANETKFKIEEPGVYYGQCMELCGIDHGFMPIAVEALPPEKFAAWVRSRGGSMPSADAPQTAALARPAAASAKTAL